MAIMYKNSECHIGKKLQIDSYSYSYITKEKPFKHITIYVCI